jgi:predicted nucleic acid-binding protein
MYLIDSNIIIYSHSSKYEYLRGIFLEQSVCISEITRVEVLGYHDFVLGEKAYYYQLIGSTRIIFPTQEIFDKAIEIKQSKNIKLGDSIIAATALVNDLVLYTRNVLDFKKIPDIKVINPIKE